MASRQAPPLAADETALIQAIGGLVGVALENAASIAGLMVATECLITEAPEKEKKPATPTPPEDY